MRHLRIAALVAFLVFGVRAEAQQVPEPGSVAFVDVDGVQVRVIQMGLATREPGEPLILFEAGATNSLEVWGDILSEVAESAAVVAYDRAGLGQSEWDGVTPTPQHVSARLHRLLERIGADPPYVLVGYSWGGVLSRYFAAAFPEEIAGIVFVDPGPVVTQTIAEQLAPFDSVGVGREGYDAFWDGYEGFFQRAGAAIRAEFEVFHGLMEMSLEERNLDPLPDVPVMVLVSGKYMPPPPGLVLPYDPVRHHDVDVRHRLKMLGEWALSSSRGSLFFSSDVTHAIPAEDPDLIVWAVKRVIRAAQVPPR